MRPRWWRWAVMATSAGLLAACGRTSGATAATPRSACALLTLTEVSAVLGHPATALPEVTPRDQSDCVWSVNGPPPPSWLGLSVSWQAATVASFMALHRGGGHPARRHPAPAVAEPVISTVRVDGVRAYWQVQAAASGAASAPAPVLSATSHGYVVTLSAPDTGEGPMERALGEVLHRL